MILHSMYVRLKNFKNKTSNEIRLTDNSKWKKGTKDTFQRIVGDERVKVCPDIKLGNDYGKKNIFFKKVLNSYDISSNYGETLRE